MHFVKKSQDASSGKVHHSQVHRPGAFRPAVPAVMRPLPPGIICPRTLGPTTHRWKKVDWTHPAIGRIRCSDASLVQLLNASGQRRIAERGGQLDASRFPTHPGNDASPLTGRIQFPDASGQRRIVANWTHPVFRTHPGSDASLGEEITGRIQFPDASGQRRIAVDWTHPVPGRIRAATHRCELDASSFRTHPGSDASLGEEITGRIQFPDASGQRRIAVDWTHPVPGRIRAATHRCELDASSFRTHPGSDASLGEEMTGRIQFPDASGQRRITAKLDASSFRTHPGSDASLGREITGRIRFRTHPGSDASLRNWTHPVPGRIRAATHRCELDASSFRTHPGSDASLGEEITGRIQFRTHPGSDASLGEEITGRIQFRTHPGSDASLGEKITGRIQFRTHPGSDASLGGKENGGLSHYFRGEL
jgi:hypothetical protein